MSKCSLLNARDGRVMYNNLTNSHQGKSYTMIDFLNRNLIDHIKSAQEACIIQAVQVGNTPLKNELVFFIKPELLAVDDDAKILNSFELIKEQFSAHQVSVNGMAILPGKVLAEYEIMNRHYGFINQLSRLASEMVTPEIREQIFETLKRKDEGSYKILGGHEFLQAYQASIETLNEIWFGQGAQKLRSGFYFIPSIYHGDPILLVNGFHPSQLAHFTREDHRIVLMLLQTDTNWFDLKFDLVGDTFPERANPESIRGQLYTNPGAYGQRQVGINTNGVHLSAGPFEAAFEVVNFFGEVLSLNPQKKPPLAIKQAIKVGFDPSLALDLLKNPPIGESDLFSETENLNTLDAVLFAKDQINKG